MLERARLILFFSFLIALLLQIAFIVSVFAQHAIRQDDFAGLVKIVLQIYSVHFAVMLGGTFAGKQARNSKIKSSNLPFAIAFSTTTTWNLLLLMRSMFFFFSASDSAEAFGDFIEAVAGNGSFLVVGSLTYFFSKQ
jgi:hypothetical protein